MAMVTCRRWRTFHLPGRRSALCPQHLVTPDLLVDWVHNSGTLPSEWIWSESHLPTDMRIFSQHDIASCMKALHYLLAGVRLKSDQHPLARSASSASARLLIVKKHGAASRQASPSKYFSFYFIQASYLNIPRACTLRFLQQGNASLASVHMRHFRIAPMTRRIGQKVAATSLVNKSTSREALQEKAQPRACTHPF